MYSNIKPAYIAEVGKKKKTKYSFPSRFRSKGFPEYSLVFAVPFGNESG